ncbi:MAG: ferritin family protein [Betaproteobacteria bacterium]
MTGSGRGVPRNPAVLPAADAQSGPLPDAMPRTLSELMTQALVMELDAVQRYTEFADAMEIHNNRDVAALFRTMASIEQKHADQIMTTMKWSSLPIAAGPHRWRTFDSPETTASEDVHYLMQPYHALQLALAAERRAARFFGELALATKVAAVRKAALEMQAEEHEHVELVKSWLAKVAPPAANWADDPDPPHYMD